MDEAPLRYGPVSRGLALAMALFGLLWCLFALRVVFGPSFAGSFELRLVVFPVLLLPGVLIAWLCASHYGSTYILHSWGVERRDVFGRSDPLRWSDVKKMSFQKLFRSPGSMLTLKGPATFRRRQVFEIPSHHTLYWIPRRDFRDFAKRVMNEAAAHGIETRSSSGFWV